MEKCNQRELKTFRASVTINQKRKHLRPKSNGKSVCPVFRTNSRNTSQNNTTVVNTHGKDKGRKMFELNDILVYGNNGVCKVSDIRKEKFSGTPTMYYILSPVFGSQSTLYVPTENSKLASKLRPVMMKETLDNMMTTAKNSEVKWESDDRTRNEKFHDIIAKGLSSELLMVIKCIVIRRNELKQKIKKLHAADERALALCEKIAGEEYAYAFGVEVEDAVSHIENELAQAA